MKEHKGSLVRFGIMCALLATGYMFPENSVTRQIAFAAMTTVYATGIKSRMWKTAVIVAEWTLVLVMAMGVESSFMQSVALAVFLASTLWGKDDDGESPFKKILAKLNPPPRPVAMREAV